MKDIIASTCVGIGQIAIGHPFDTTLVLIQNRKNWRGLPISHYYKGWRFPLTNSLVNNMTVFPINERLQKYTNSYFLSGFISGTFAFPTVYGFNHYKIHKQTNQKTSIRKLLKGRGLFSTFLRESTAMSVYFGSYHWARDNGYNTFISGGFSGLANWTFSYPIDVIMSRQIAQNISISQAFKQGALWKGFSICAFRAVIVNSINFSIYEFVLNNL